LSPFRHASKALALRIQFRAVLRNARRNLDGDVLNPVLLMAAVLVFLALLGGGLMLFAVFIRRRVEAAVPPIGRFVQIGDTRLHIVERGSGPTVVLVHGLGAQLRNFNYALVERLAVNFRVVCLDRPGCGYSTRPPTMSASLSGQADTIAKLLTELRLEKPIVVGHSYGGTLALALALNHPESVGSLALIAPLTHLQTEVPPAFRDFVIRSAWLRKLIAWTIATPMGIAASSKILDEVFRPDAAPADFATAAGGLLALRPGHFVAASADLVNVSDDLPAMVQRYPSIRVPVGILFGRHDEILSYQDHGTAMQSMIKGSTVSLVDGGHMLPIVAPDETARWITEFAQRLGRCDHADSAA
jgi:pimeloyl-ACP methyl ester carboxylesterase